MKSSSSSKPVSALNNQQKLDYYFNLQTSARAQRPYIPTEKRVELLKELKSMLLENEPNIYSALQSDCAILPQQSTSLLSSIFTDAISRIDFLIEKLSPAHQFSIPHSISNFLFYDHRYNLHKVIPLESLGIVGIFGALNYPFSVLYYDLANAIFSGNRVILKPYENAPKCFKLIESMIEECFESEYVAVIGGGRLVSQSFCGMNWNHLMFAGSASIGAMVKKIADQKQTSMSISYTGRNSTILMNECLSLDFVEEIIAGKCIENGRFCLGSKVVHVDERVLNQFLDLVKEAYGNVSRSCKYRGIVQPVHFNRIQGYLKEAKDRGTQVLRLGGVEGGDESDEVKSRNFGLVVVVNGDKDLSLFKEDLKAPVLIVKTYAAVRQAIENVVEVNKGGEWPVVVYLMSTRKDVFEYVVKNGKWMGRGAMGMDVVWRQEVDRSTKLVEKRAQKKEKERDAVDVRVKSDEVVREEGVNWMVNKVKEWVASKVE